MRLLAVLMVALLCAANHPAWAYRETQPGDEDWPEISGRVGMKAFLGKWMPQCNVGVIQNAGDMIVHEDGRISYERNKVLPTRYRVIEETPHYVVTLVQAPTLKGDYFDVYFWAFRPLGASFHPRGWTKMSAFGINECPVYGNNARKQAIWNFSDAELAEFWATNKFCHPALTQKVENGSYWGGRWYQPCYYGR